MNLERKIVFIVGNSRSGTTMLGRVLGKNSTVYTFDELHFFEQVIDPSQIGIDTEWQRERLLNMLERLLTSIRDGYFEKLVAGKYTHEANEILIDSKTLNPVSVYAHCLYLETEKNNFKIPCEQTPRYLFSAQEILDTFPNAKIINMVRDPRAVMLSQKNKWKRRFLGAKNIPLKEALRAWVNYHPYLISKLWVSCIRQAEKFSNNENFMTIRFEDVVSAPEKTITDVCRFLDIQYEEKMILVPNVGSSMGADVGTSLGLDASKLDSWKQGGLSKEEIYICQSQVNAVLSRYNYESIEATRNPFKFFGSYFLLVFKGGLLFLLNFRRNKNIFKSIKRRFFT